MPKKILIVTEYFYPSNNSTSYYLTEIAKKISEDNNVSVVCNTNLEKYDELDSYNLNVFRSKEVNLSKNNIILRTLKFFISSVKLSILATRKIKKNSEVLSVTNPAFIIIYFAILKKFKKFSYTILVYDVFPENLIAANILNNKSITYKIIKKIYDWAYCKADQLIVIGRDMEEVMINKVGNKVSIKLIENWCDYHKIIPTDKAMNKILLRLNITNKKVFLFAGNLGRVQGIENMLKVAELVKNKDFVLLFIGNGAMEEVIKQHIDSSIKKNVLYAGSFPMSEQNLFLNACDVAIVSLSDNMYGLGVPSKSYFNMAAAKPILYIGDLKSEIARVISENNIGWVVENGNPNVLSEVFDLVLKNDTIYKEYGRKAREVVMKKYSKKAILTKYRTLYK